MSEIGSKKRVIAYAQDYGVPPQVILKLLSDKGIKVHSQMSPIESSDWGAIQSEVVAEKERRSARAKSLPKKPAPVHSSAQSVASSAQPEGTVSVKEVKGKVAKVTIRRGSHEDSPPAPEVPHPAEAPAVVAKADVPVEPVQQEHAAPVVEAEPQPIVREEPANSKAAPAAEAPHVEHKEEPASSVSPVAEVQAPAPSGAETPEPPQQPVAPPAPVRPAPSSGLKATIIEKPSAEILARIERSRQQQMRGGSRSGGPGRGGPGYTGSFGRAPSGDRGPGGRGPGRSDRSTTLGDAASAQGFDTRGFGRGGSGGFSGQSGRGNPPGGPGAATGRSGGFGGGTGAPGNRRSGPPTAGGGTGTQGGAAGRGRGPGGGGGPSRGRGGRGRETSKERADRQKEQADAVKQNFNRVMASLSKNPVKKTYRKESGEAAGQENRRVLHVSDFITVGELAGLMEQMPARVIAKCMEMGMMVTINHRMDFDTIQVLADEFGFAAELMEEYEEEKLGLAIEDNPEDLVPRAPVVTVMGHVDHGKTSLLDYIRKANVVAGESGGITQHIGAYEVATPHGRVTFLDTPGHEAFTAMRARGSQVTDVIVLVVAADDMVRPQTVECIQLAKNAKVPLVVAITKIDLPTANPDKIRAQLAERGVEVEQWGGQTSCVEISAKAGTGMDKLLETLALETEVLELKANPDARARGTVIESQLDKGKGSMATILVQNGSLHVGDIFVCGSHSGRVRAMLDERGKSRDLAGPSSPCQVMGFDGTPQAGDDLVVFDDEKTAREIASNRRMAARERELRFRKHMSLEQVYDRVKSGEFSELNLIVKADVDGSAEALAASLEKLSNKEVKINVIRKAVGGINDSDILLASASDAVIIAFHLLPSPTIREMAEEEGVEIKTYRIIYEAIEDVQGVVEGMLKPVTREEVVGEAEIRELFKIPKVGIIAGVMVKSGQVDRESKVRVYRHGVEMGVTQVQSLKRHKDDAKSVPAGQECGIGLKGFEAFEVGDMLAFFKEVKVARTLADLEKEKDN